MFSLGGFSPVQTTGSTDVLLFSVHPWGVMDATESAQLTECTTMDGPAPAGYSHRLINIMHMVSRHLRRFGLSMWLMELGAIHILLATSWPQRGFDIIYMVQYLELSYILWWNIWSTRLAVDCHAVTVNCVLHVFHGCFYFILQYDCIDHIVPKDQ